MEYLSHTLNLTFIFVVLTVSLNLILGYGGMASMAHAAFFCIGGYVSTIVTMHFDIVEQMVSDFVPNGFRFLRHFLLPGFLGAKNLFDSGLRFDRLLFVVFFRPILRH